MTRQDEELLAEWLLRWEEAREQGRAPPAAELAGDRGDLAAELERRIRILEETAWLDEPLADEELAGPIGDGSTAPLDPWPAPTACVEDEQPPSIARTIPRRAIDAGLVLMLPGVVVASVALAVLATRLSAPHRPADAASDVLSLARTDFFHARYPEAEAGFTRVLGLEPEDHEALVSRGISRLKLGRFEAAVADFTAALERRPTDHEALRQRAQAYAYLRRYDDAIADLERLLSAGADAGPIRQRIEALRDARAGAAAPAASDQRRRP